MVPCKSKWLTHSQLKTIQSVPAAISSVDNCDFEHLVPVFEVDPPPRVCFAVCVRAYAVFHTVNCFRGMIFEYIGGALGGRFVFR